MKFGKWLLPVCALLLALAGCAQTAGPIELLEPSMDSPMGPRKTMNYGGCRYAFLENGAVYDLEGRMGETLGVLTGDILSDPGAYGREELAATFALGGTVRSLKGVDPRFRVAVELEGKGYICENVDTLGEKPVSLEAYIAAADLEKTAKSMEIRDHMGLELLKTAEPGALLEALKKADPAELSDEDYAAIGAAQNAGESFRVLLKLRDGTDFGICLIPQMHLAMVGDNKYAVTLPEDLAALFADLPRMTPPQY